ncbi:hypothetical protein GLOIN_2v1782508 [Rhizophagus irregularis DAOM 181602=DAOM 197198]|uniref:Uncharacterized protein n=1 Tax=Rhizophagus irregularis (strain DAOM 181602 / DAOM 197198 / MUCL 43194) TaxID=747089 RepID=A0A2P4PHA8_RHIID|nr:hypothetical protein GLOIN_2v1782508 [Rhizophagus irregularis DAOM 181602=DAOM 197198]POG64727.1 hypothetical protein GLOIN_2v1782508 [Rhizophagus irregularis DAOM 181602=DAOM 197198]|eukprot:XP_025171593.1 hypothetical protein GLOIN_2v1782508 [Rhizophagus irregularis DAOM 181602=DAOM 197198]
MELLIAIDEPNFHKLIPCVQEYLIEHRYEFLQQNIIEILETGIIAQNPSISQDATNWSKDDITIIEKTLHDLLY